MREIFFVVRNLTKLKAGQQQDLHPDPPRPEPQCPLCGHVHALTCLEPSGMALEASGTVDEGGASFAVSEQQAQSLGPKLVTTRQRRLLP